MCDATVPDRGPASLRRPAGGSVRRRARGRSSGPCRARRTPSSAAGAARRCGPGGGRPGRTRIPLSGSRTSVTSPTWIEPRPSNTTIACSEPGWRCHASSAPGHHLDLRDRERHRPEVAGLDEERPPDAVVLGDAARSSPVGRAPRPRASAAARRGRPARIGVDGREQRQRVQRPLVADPVELGRRLVEHVAGPDQRPPDHAPRRARTPARRPRGTARSRRHGGGGRSPPPARSG